MSFRSTVRRQNRRKPLSRRPLGSEQLEARLLMFGGAISIDEAFGTDKPPVVSDDLRLRLAPEVPEFSSDPDATHTLFLDFDGYVYHGMIGSRENPSVPVFSMDDDYATFSGEELEAIEESWRWVSEDFSPFDVNVTTVDPGQAAFDDGTALRVAIGGTSEWYDEDDPISGVAIGHPFVNDAYPNVVWTFSEVIQARAGELAKRDGDGRDVEFLSYLANTISHEAGHGYGLEHHSDYSAAGVKLATYTGGEELRTPIMGSNRARDRATWDETELMKKRRDFFGNEMTNADGDVLWEFDKIQNDMTEIAAAIGYRSDDHGDSVPAATPLQETGISGLAGAGVIERITDADYFTFTTTGGAAWLAVNVVEEMGDRNADGADNDLDGLFDEGDEYDWGAANLDARLELYRINDLAAKDLTLVAWADPDDRLGAELVVSLDRGDYAMVVRSHGHEGDAGQYTVTGGAPRTKVDIPSVPVFWAEPPQLELPSSDPRATRLSEPVVRATRTPLPSAKTTNSPSRIAAKRALAVDQALVELDTASLRSARLTGLQGLRR